MGIEFFNGYKNQDLAVFSDGIRYRLALDEVVEERESSVRDGEQYLAFSLIFSSDNEQHLNQGVYQFQFGEELKDIFIVPMAPEGGRFIYQAVFN